MRDNVEVEIHAGSAEDIVVDLTDDVDAPLLTLDGWTAKAQAKHDPADLVPLVEWSTAAGTLVLGNSQARLKVTAALAAASLGWTWRMAWFDLNLIAPAGQGSLPNRPTRGLIRVIPGITGA